MVSLSPQLSVSAQALGDSFPDALLAVNPEGRILLFNRAAERLFGYSAEEAVGQQVALLTASPMQLAHLTSALGAALAKSEAVTLELEQRKRDGSSFSTSVVVSPFDEGAERGATVVVRTLGTPTDRRITQLVEPVAHDAIEHKRAEEAFRTLSRAVEQSPTSIVITDRDGLIEYANPRFSQVTGYLLEEVKGKNPRIFKSGETSPEEYATLWRAIASGQEWHGEFHNRKKNGELYWESASISPVLDASGVITHFVAVKEDITETKRLQRENLQVQKMKAFTQLAAGIAHDFNNLLTVIQGNLSVVVDGDLSQDQAEAIADVTRAAQRAAELTRQLLTFSRRKSPTLAALDLNELLGEAEKTLRGILGEQVEVEVCSSPEARVLADRSMMEQVLVNLALNARDAMPMGGRLVVSIEPVRVDAEYVRRSPRARQGDFVALAVADTGTGIAPAALSRLFEPFFTTKELGKGTGLGLATVFGIVEQHQGWVTVDSEVGQGTSVRIFLPRLQAREEVRRPSGSLVLEPKY